MDRGPLEREMARQVKMAVARNGHKRSRDRWATSPFSPSVEKRHEDNTAATEGTQPGLTIQGPLSPQDSDSFPMLLGGVSTADFAANNLYWQDPKAPGETDDMGNFTLSPSTVYTPHNSVAFGNFSLPEDYAARHESSTPITLFGLDTQSNTVTEESNRAAIKRPRLQPIDRCSHTRCTSTISEDSQASSIGSTPSKLSSCYYSGSSTSAENAFLLSYYMSRVIYAQFSFSLMSDPGSTQWWQFVLLGSEHAMEISMMVGRAHYISGKELSEAEFDNKYEDDMFRVASILKSILPPTSPSYLTNQDQRISPVIATCASLIQNIHLEVCPAAIFLSRLSADTDTDILRRIKSLARLHAGGSTVYTALDRPDCLQKQATRVSRHLAG